MSSGTVLLCLERGNYPTWVVLEQALRLLRCEGGGDKTGMARAAVIFATEDHATTSMKGGTESKIQSTLRPKLGQYGKSQVRARVVAVQRLKEGWNADPI